MRGRERATRRADSAPEMRRNYHCGTSSRAPGTGVRSAPPRREKLMVRSLANDNDATQQLNNGESEAGFTSNSTKLCGSIACTTIWSSGGTLKLCWYVSTDNLITTSDTEIGSQDIGLNPNEPFTFTR
jgi:hypothetical protein